MSNQTGLKIAEVVGPGLKTRGRES